jgi:esterase/lipase superfamily enzyme
MLRLERDHVDQQVEAVGDGERAVLVAVERDDRELALRRRARADVDVPAAKRE